MYLKDIKISGFKSFADKINIGLDNNLTCIVGPNGSGKSNIVDAVKWVLGEQSVKTLRGDGNMTDVIFSGSKSRKMLNLASVTLVFDNSDNYLKVPYTEISITRKVFRNGDNEYYINNEKCRLKDINDLFLDSGIGKYAMNIISQGEVANIINSSPYDRRSVIEEAAGVLKYKKRKEEALRKLSKTNENMVRVKDIISELEEQVEPLKEQKEVALKYIDIEKELKGIEIALIAKDLDLLNKEYHDGVKEIDKLNDEIATNMSKSSSGDVSIEKLKKSINDIDQEIVNKNNLYVSLTRELERLNGEKNILKERSKYDSDDIKVHENVTMLKENKLNLENRIKIAEIDIKDIESSIKSVNNLLEELHNKLLLNKGEKQSLEKEIYNANKKANDLEYKIKSLNNYIEQGAGINPNVNKVLSNPKLNGIHNTIANLIDTDEKYSLALSIALGGAKDYVVVDNTKKAKEAINYLKDNNLGRVTFFPLDVIKERFIEKDILKSIEKEKGFINIFSNIVSFDNKYENIIKNQLGNVILVDDIDSANSIRDIVKSRYKIVTLTGEVINVGGSITGGKVKTNSIITERYELSNMKHEKETILNNLEILRTKLNNVINEESVINDNIFGLEKQQVLKEEEQKAKEVLEKDLKEELDNINKELNNLGSVLNDTLKKEEDKIINLYYETSLKKDNIEKESKKLLTEKEALQAKLDEEEATYKLNNTSLRDLENKLKEKEIETSKASVKMDNLLNILSETYQMTFEKARDNYILELEENTARKKVHEYRKELKNIGTVNIGAIEEYDRVNTRYEFLKKQMEDLEEASLTLLEIIDELDVVMKDEFLKAYKLVNAEFDKVFKELFKGGNASLKLTDPDNLLETGVLINVTPPGKKLSSISLLSGGEKTLTAISLLFAVLNIKKIPFCIFDEIEAALDEANVDKVGSYLGKYNGNTQLIIITHKKKTMEYANTLYGITMQESGVSKLVSVKLV